MINLFVIVLHDKSIMNCLGGYYSSLGSVYTILGSCITVKIIVFKW